MPVAQQRPARDALLVLSAVLVAQIHILNALLHLLGVIVLTLLAVLVTHLYLPNAVLHLLGVIVLILLAVLVTHRISCSLCRSSSGSCCSTCMCQCCVVVGVAV